ncbi:hypothetical protein [Megamonas funiformis]|uniref:hypothetical protein n=1 Tax=Megamonas funiformis TaxID=437897 RepID=UPI001CD800A4|nr:hypothetical protein [Megamonas funiformis]UBS48144.1 hypothetical protein LCQ45_08215 [Megamonas funiformis]GLU98392.1 hypothetical protein Mfun01_10370 [Megamonas funiformis]
MKESMLNTIDLKKNKNNNKEIYNFFLVVFYMLIFEDLFSLIIPLFKITDELIALSAILFFIYNLYKNKWKYHKNKMTLYLFLFVMITLIGNLRYNYQPILLAVLPDLFLSLKFWLALYIGMFLFSKLNFDIYGKNIGFHIKLVTNIFILLFIVDLIFGGIFPGAIRYGFKSTQLFYEAHSIFVAICIFLLSLLTLVKKHVRFADMYIFILIMFIISTMRSKAFGAIVVYFFLYYLIILSNKYLNKKYLSCLIILALIVGASQILFYFFDDNREGIARYVLQIVSLQIANDHFPLGGGFGTFAEYYSGKVYSPLYYNYEIDAVQGITENEPSFLSDVFWPMIIGQSGYIGLIIYIYILKILFDKIQKIRFYNNRKYMVALFVFLYLIISSTAESAFVHYISIPLAIVLGMCLKH